MKNLLTIYNVVFLLLGNILLSNLHHLEHDHGHEPGHTKCEDCIFFENNNNYILEDDKLDFLTDDFNLFICESIDVVEYFVYKTYLPRAPPIS